MREIPSEILELSDRTAGLAGFLAVHDTARHVIPQLAAACLLVGLFCGFRRLWVGGAVWMATAIIALWPIVPNYLPHQAARGTGCRLAVVTFNHLEGHSDNAGAAKLLAGLRPDIVLF